MKHVFFLKNASIVFLMCGACFGVFLSVVLYVLQHFPQYFTLMSSSFVWGLFVGTVSFLWLVSYLVIGSWIPPLVHAHAESSPTWWAIMIPSVIFYAIVFFVIGVISTRISRTT